MALPAYPAARSVSDSVQGHFARHIASARERGQTGLADAPDADSIETILEAAFWASLRREEGKIPRISLAFVAPTRALHPLRFEQPIPLDPALLAKLAPAVERPGIHLGVWNGGGTFQVWGTTRDLPPLCLVVEVVTSGLLVVKYRSEPFGKFVNVAVLEGDQIKIVDELGGVLVPDCPELVNSLLGAVERLTNGQFVNLLVQLAASMRAHGRGGTLLVVPSDTDVWRESVVAPVLYSVRPPFSELAELMRVQADDQEWQDDVRRAVDAVAGLTAVDGAAVISDRYDVLAFGAKITRKRGSPPVEYVNLTEPIEGSVKTLATPTQLGGTRHLSAAQFAHDQRDATALVASQDGRFTIFKWSPREQFVHAHRVDALLL
ncbi:MAG: putative sensor domain DACNV-containing protein [Vicinamibacterales bacterium]